MLTATLTRPGKIAAEGITLTSREPTLALCRALIAAGHADGPMTVVDSATGRPTMTVQSIAKAALLTVDEGNGCRFARWRPFPGRRGAPGMASDHAPVGAGGFRARRDPGGCVMGRRRERRKQDDRTPDRIEAALALIRQSNERWHGLAVWLAHTGMDRDADLLDRLAARAARMERDEHFRAQARASRRREA
jgi:hypothetical protein